MRGATTGLVGRDVNLSPCRVCHIQWIRMVRRLGLQIYPWVQWLCSRKVLSYEEKQCSVHHCLMVNIKQKNCRCWKARNRYCQKHSTGQAAYVERETNFMSQAILWIIIIGKLPGLPRGCPTCSVSSAFLGLMSEGKFRPILLWCDHC